MTADRPTRRGLRVVGVIALVGLLHVGFLLFVELDRLVRHRAAIATLEAEVAEARAEAEALRQIAERAGDDVFREQLARGQGFLYEGETRVVVLPSP